MKYQQLALPAGAAALAFLLYLPAVYGGLVWDDPLILHHPLYRPPVDWGAVLRSPLVLSPNYYRPLAVATLALLGEAAPAQHLLNILLHALNTGPFRYQLTPIGAPMPNLYIAQEIQGNRFQIAGGVPGQKVSWEVTAVRNDPYLRDHPVQAEVDKPAEECGTYLYPQGYGQPEEMGLDYQRNADLFNRAEAMEGQR